MFQLEASVYLTYWCACFFLYWFWVLFLCNLLMQAG